MAPINFDTLKFAHRLKETGFTDEQAEGATKALTEALEASPKDLPQDLASRHDLIELESRLRYDTDVMKLELQELERRLTIKLSWLAVLAVSVAVGATTALLKLL